MGADSVLGGRELAWRDASVPNEIARYSRHLWNEAPIGPDYAATIAPHYFNWRKASIYGGTNEIQKNIIAKMVLGF